MSLPALPPWNEIPPDERLVQTWDINLDLDPRAPVDTYVKVVLTDRRLRILNLPVLRPPRSLADRLRRKRLPPFLKNALGKWNVMLDAELGSLPDPRFAAAMRLGDATIYARKAMYLGDRHFWIGEGAPAEALVERIRAERKVVRSQGSHHLP